MELGVKISKNMSTWFMDVPSVVDNKMSSRIDYLIFKEKKSFMNGDGNCSSF